MEWIAAIIGSLATILVAVFKYKSDKNSDVKKQLLVQTVKDFEKKIADTETQLIQAMENSITDVPNIRIRLMVLRKQLVKAKKAAGLMSIIILLMFSGCKTQNTVIIGERVYMPKPGDVLTVPALKTPAKQWYLIDDVAMLNVLGVNKPVIDKDSVTGSDFDADLSK